MVGDLSRRIDAPSPTPASDGALQAWAGRLLREPTVQDAQAHLERDDPRTLADQQALTRIPAPPFGEQARAARMAELMADAGLEDPHCDSAGNVLGRFPLADDPAGSPLVVAAHLDTVFPASTPVDVHADGDRLVGPGIADDGRGLAALLALTRALRVSGRAFRRPLWVVATVGEEGAGDLRGVRHLFGDGGRFGSGCSGFLSLDGAGLRRIVHVGLGSLRYRVRVSGPGGHSWIDWGTPNPIHALGRAVAELTSVRLPQAHGTTLSVCRWAGGTSVNALPRQAWIEFEIRSADTGVLADLDRRVRALLHTAVFAATDTGGARSRTSLALDVELIGDRPAGYTPADSALVRAAVAATRAVGADPELGLSSTDANVPMAASIPAITLGAGGEAGLTHTPDEWYRNVEGPRGLLRALLTLVLTDEMATSGAA